ncbi:hypothetical protein H6P81_019708 [Aristolochia fimbriata]|uniref:Maternal effect embryo arrest 22 n=1 Tax=Aristolochia fimbriata TaxID=158543 RepID=A0AAV7DTG0_ARIFI|nr:hypothetical protein H6P81_019708 [Aristolochia fimbriata]
MTADKIRDSQTVNACCASLQVRYRKLEEKRNALRQAVKLLDHQTSVLESEKKQLKIDNENEIKQVKLHKEEHEKEYKLRCELEQEVSSLKAEISTLRKNHGDCEAEVRKLSELLEKERVQAKQERQYKENESKIRYKLENEISSLKVEISNLKESTCSRGQKDWEVEVKKLKVLLEKEKARGDSALKKADLERDKAAEAWKLLKSEKIKVEESKSITDVLRKRVDELRACLETLETEAREVKEGLVLEKSKVDEANRRADAETKKANRHKKRADLKSVKAEKLKISADQLHKELAIEKEKVAVLQKEIRHLVSEEKEFKSCLCSDAKGDKDKNMLKKKPKEEKVRTGETQRSSNLEKAHEYLVKEEMSLLKKDILQFSRRLHALESCLSHCFECIDVEKVHKYLLKEGISLLQKDTLQFSHRLNVLEGCLFHGFEGIDGSEQFTGECRKLCDTDSHYQACHAEMGGLHCPDENEMVKSQYCANGDFSVVGAAVDFAMTLLPVLRGSNLPPISGICSELESLVGGSVRNKSQNSGMHSISTSISDRKLMGSQGRGALSNLAGKSAQDNSKEGSSISRLTSEVTKEQNLDTGVMVECGDGFRLGEEIIATHSNSTLLQNEVETKAFGSSRKRKGVRDSPEEKKVVLKKEKKLSTLHETCCQKNGMLVSILSQRDDNLESIQNENNRSKMSIERGKVDSAQKAFSPMSGEDLEHYLIEQLEVKGNYMKLLELDDEADEERFRKAMRVPLSPTLPEIESPRYGIPVDDETESLVRQRLMIEDDPLDHSYNSDVIDTEIDANKFKLRPLETIHGLSSTSACYPCKLNGKVGNEVNGVYQSGNKSHSFSAGDMTASGSTSIYFILFPNMIDETIHRVLSPMDNFVSQSSIFSRTDCAVSEILLAVASQGDLSPEEKACMFFSLLVCRFTVVASSKFPGSKSGDISENFSTFVQEISKEISHSVLNFSFAGICEAPVLLTLIETFLLDRKILVFDGSQCGNCTQSEWSSKITLRDNTIGFLSSKAASFEQLMGGAIILASLCNAFGHIDFICEASHNIARICRDDSTLVLSILHSFACVCGKNYSMASNCTLIMATVRSIVSQLESGPEAAESQCKFLECGQCPFGEGEASVDKVVCLLMDRLQEFANDETSHLRLKRAEDIPVSDTWFHNLNMNKSHISLECKYVAEKILDHYSDTVSLLELLACYATWDWIYDKMIPQLLRILESPASPQVSAAVLILIGQLGRFGMEDGGCVLKQIEEIVCCLSNFLHLRVARKMDLATQISAASALVNFLSLECKDLFHNNEEPTGGTSQFGQAIIIIRKWFHQLMHEQQLLVLSLFQSTDVHKTRKNEKVKW